MAASAARLPQMRALVVAAALAIAAATSVSARSSLRHSHLPSGLADKEAVATRNGYNLTELDMYVARPDSTYGFVDTGATFTGSIPLLGSYTGYVLNMTSQAWLTPEDSSRHIWWHLVVLIVPEAVLTNVSTMYITGNGNGGDGGLHDIVTNAENEDRLIATTLALTTHSVTTIVFQVPNESIVFPADPIQKSRSEDAIIAFTWIQFIADPTRPEWIALFPMVKATVRAMDTVQTYCSDEFGLEVDGFVVAGGSKRGWTTWLTGAVDRAMDNPRIKMIVPIVYDELNFLQNIRHHYRAYGNWSFALEDYWELNVTSLFDSPGLATIMDYIDPFSYLDRYADLPKVVMTTAGDEFFLPDDHQYFWPQMPEPKFWLTLPNSEHSCVTGILEAVPSLSAFLSSFLYTKLPPEPRWTVHNETGEIVVTVPQGISDLKLKKAELWSATTKDGTRRDFRLINDYQPCSLPAQGKCLNPYVLWASYGSLSPVNRTDDSVTYSARMNPPEEGWRAFLIDLQFEHDSIESSKRVRNTRVGWPIDLFNVELSTGISIVPSTFPFPNCSGEGCRGGLI